MRTILTGPTSFYVNTQTGDLANDGLSPDSPLPQPQDVFDRLYANYDLGGQKVDVWCADGQTYRGVDIKGLMVGQVGPSVTLHGASTFGRSTLKPIPGHYAIGIAWGAILKAQNVICDQSGGQQDCISLGAGGRLLLIGKNRLIQNNLGFNHISAAYNCSIDVYVDDTGKGELHFQGRAQCGMQLDVGTCLQSQCNFIHGIISFHTIPDARRQPPYWSDAFCDVSAGSKAILGGTDWYGTGNGYKFRIREGGALQLNTEGEPGALAHMFGSANTAWPIRGYLS